MKIATVRDLFDILNDLSSVRLIDFDFEIWLSSDEEGNEFAPLLDEPKVSFGVTERKIILYPASSQSVTEL